MKGYPRLRWSGYRFFVGIILLGLLWGCQSAFLKKKPKTAPPEAIQTVKDYLEWAENLPAGEDTIATDFYYLKAMNRIDSLLTIYESDTSLVALQQQVNMAYDDYLHEQTALISDTLTSEQVMEELDEIYASGDSALSKLDSLAGPEVPIVLNQKVERAIHYFSKTNRGRKVFRTWLQRAGRYEQLVKGLLREVNAPEELFYLAMIESGLRPTARSYARAVGMWQFIAATGRAYGLNQSWWYDDRHDPLKATRAAGRHLLDLYERFGDWYLAIAGYNFNPRKIEKRMASYNVSEFWDLPRLPRQTRNYVPTYLAAVTIASNPAQYGFDDIQPDPPLVFDTVTVKGCIDLNTIAEAIGSSFAELKALNPALLRWCTPPDVEQWMLYLPPGTRETFLAKYEDMPKEQQVKWVHHRIRSGETLSTIARKYGVAMSEIKRFNKIKGSLIRAGHNLVIPIPRGRKQYREYVASHSPKPVRKKHQAPARPVENVPGRNREVYIVKNGDSLWEVARRFGVSVNEIREWNGLGHSRLIKPGQPLNIWLLPQNGSPKPPMLAKAGNDLLSQVPGLSDAGQKGQTYTVRPGDTLWDIAQAHNVSIRDLKRWNGKRSNTIKPGEKLVVRGNE